MATINRESAGISKSQIRLIKVGQKKIGLDDGTYREMLRNRFGVESCTMLTRDQADELIIHLAKSGFKIKRKRQAAGTEPPREAKRTIPREGTNVIRMASKEELAKIGVLMDLVQWPDREDYRRWMKKKFGLSKVKSSNDAFLVIEGLKNVFENYMRKTYGDDWWNHKYPEGNVMGYIRRHRPAAYR